IWTSTKGLRFIAISFFIPTIIGMLIFLYFFSRLELDFTIIALCILVVNFLIIFFTTRTRNEQIRDLIRKILEKTSDEQVEIQKKLFPKFSDSCLYKIIGDICKRDQGAFISMLQADTDIPWGVIALSSTNFATPDVIRESLHLLRAPETKEN